MKIIGRKRSVILNFKLFIIFFPEELRARSTRESINLFQKCKILIMGLFRPLECLLGMVSVPDYGLCFVPCFGPSPTSIFFRTQISFWTKPNISESRNQLFQHSNSQFFFHLEKSMTIPSIFKTYMASNHYFKTLLVLFEAISSKQCSTVSSFHYKGTKSMPSLFTRDQTNKQIYILLLCILLVIHHSLHISYKLFYITSGSSEIHVFVYRFHGNSDIKRNLNPFQLLI